MQKSVGKRQFSLISKPSSSDTGGASAKDAVEVSTAAKEFRSSARPSFDRGVLRQYLTPNAAQCEEIVLYQAPKMFSIIRDKYPKARVHLLAVIDNEWISAQTVRQLTTEHLPQLLELSERIDQLCDEIEGKSVPEMLSKESATSLRSSLALSTTASVFRVGFHSNPSLFPLHIHILSDDFDSPCLKNKKHWNSFASPFFVSLPDVLQSLQQNQPTSSCVPTEAQAEALLHKDLICHKCHQTCKTIPALKKHLLTHLHTLSTDT